MRPGRVAEPCAINLPPMTADVAWFVNFSEVVNIDHYVGYRTCQTTSIIARSLAFIGDENARLRSRLPQTERSAMQQQRRFKQQPSLQDRLASFATLARENASLLRPGAERDELLRKARQAETAAHLNEWASSPGLQPPK